MMDSDPLRSSRATSLRMHDYVRLIALCAMLYLPGSLGVTLFDRAEAGYAQMSVELAAAQSLLPTYRDSAVPNHPPAHAWLIGQSSRLLGGGELSVRLPAMLAMVLTALVTASLGARIAGRSVGLLSGGIFAVTGLTVVLGRLAVPDAMFALGVMISFAALLRSIAQGAHSGHFVVVGVGALVAVLTRGGATWLYLLPALLALVLVQRKGRVSMLCGSAIALLPALALTVTWYVYAFDRSGMLGDDVATLLLRSVVMGLGPGPTLPPTSHFWASIVLLLPWSPLVPLAVSRVLRGGEDRNLLKVLALIAATWLALELLPVKLPQFTLPLYPLIAIVLAVVLVRLESLPSNAARTWGRAWLSLQLLLALSAVLVGLWLLLSVRPRLEALSQGANMLETLWLQVGLGALAVGAVLGAGVIIAQRALIRQRWRSAAWGVVLSSGLAHAIVGAVVLTACEPLRFSRVLAEAIQTRDPGSAEIFLLGFEEPSLVYYLGHPVQPVMREDLLELLEDAPANRLVVVREQDLAAISVAGDINRVGWTVYQGFNYFAWRDEIVWVIDQRVATNEVPTEEMLEPILGRVGSAARVEPPSVEGRS